MIKNEIVQIKCSIPSLPSNGPFDMAYLSGGWVQGTLEVKRKWIVDGKLATLPNPVLKQSKEKSLVEQLHRGDYLFRVILGKGGS